MYSKNVMEQFYQFMEQDVINVISGESNYLQHRILQKVKLELEILMTNTERNYCYMLCAPFYRA